MKLDRVLTQVDLGRDLTVGAALHGRPQDLQFEAAHVRRWCMSLAREIGQSIDVVLPQQRIVVNRYRRHARQRAQKVEPFLVRLQFGAVKDFDDPLKIVSDYEGHGNVGLETFSCK